MNAENAILPGQSSIFDIAEEEVFVIEDDGRNIEQPDADPIEIPQQLHSSEETAIQEISDVPVIAQTPMQETMAPTALVFLDEPLARRLAVAWVSCRGQEEHWLEAAGIDRRLYVDAHRLTRALRINGICRDDGITDVLALKYISTIVARPLMDKGKEKGKVSK